MSVTQVRSAWKRIERWCRTNDPQRLRELNPGASKKDLRALEAATERQLPDDLRTSLSIHNGQPLRCRSDFFIGGLRLYTCEDIAREWSGWRCSLYANRQTDDLSHRFFPDNAIQHHYFNDGWLPLAKENGNSIAVDLAPGPTGTVGQIIDFGRDIYNPGVIGASWGEFLYSYADLLDIVTEISDNPKAVYEGFYRTCDLNFLDALVWWARDGRWPIVRFDPAWRTSDVMALATGISKSRDFSAMPILADALQDAGCQSEAVLNHCRDRGCTHANGCWVIDTLVSGNVTEPRWCHSD
ncbi:SMI1/KNR4 family protein [Gemmata sp. JC717]|uniref:SMI1/KNR4 family protein n=1 Tax=Gemmata algarum TaxID=2975278 RepID=UPI0021BB919B|nr:SMI1/KNR4 family protein [Gemmata algarum]MDY3557117.1 SMI1/KNR4 family protein [Gemmata algarum]